MLTYLLIGINVLVSLIGFSRMNSVTGGSSFFFSPSEVSAGRNYQGMLLSHFAHADGTHLLFNMMTLYFFGPVVELGLGAVTMLLIYVSAGIFSTLFVYYLHRADPGYRALGASDSVTGIIFAAIVLLPGMSVYFFVVPVPIPAPLFAVGYIVLSTYLMRRGVGISVTKHTLPARSQDYFSRDCWRRGDSARSFTEFRISSLERKRLLRLDRQPRETQHRHL
jgi:membrane associated rhomboid family serine protease